MNIKKLVAHRQGGAMLAGLVLMSFSLATRLILLLHSSGDVDWQPVPFLKMWWAGFLYDLAAATYAVLPLALLLALLPERIFHAQWTRRIFRGVFFLAIYLLLFIAAAEWFFWEEFNTRFNFIAVDYLVYTTEVLGNIKESYPMPVILGGLFLATALVFFGLSRSRLFEAWFESRSPARERLVWTGGLLIVPLLFTLLLNNNNAISRFRNNYNLELARNGPYSFVAAFRANELDFQTFYRQLPREEAFGRMRQLLSSRDATFTTQDPLDLTRQIHADAPEKRYNVIQITVESLSAEFLGAFGNKQNLTPNLDRLAKESLFFRNFYATGTRTDRGMEALTLSLPPTPGRSIVKRAQNENLFTLGSVFRAKGYDTTFLYSGYGYFDNMNHFFGENGYKIIDRASVPKEQVRFANSWGACDEDLYSWVLQEADRSAQAGKPFFHFVMTTSNHRPYTYPDGKIDIPSHTGRSGAVKYTDYAIGELLRQARSKPWFTNTVFVIVADHCASSAGKTELPVNKYQIPLLIYNPGLFPPRTVDTLCSQIDYAPTLLGLLHWEYPSRFFGKDIFQMKPEEERAFIGTYQKLGYLKPGYLTVLKPIRKSAVYAWDARSNLLSPLPPEKNMVEDATAYYQIASALFREGLYREIPKN